MDCRPFCSHFAVTSRCFTLDLGTLFFGRLGVDLEMRRWYHTTLVLKDTLIHTEQMTAEDLVHSTGYDGELREVQ